MNYPVRYMSEQMAAWGDKAIFMHTSGRVPAAYADQPPKQLIARYTPRYSRDEMTVPVYIHIQI